MKIYDQYWNEWKCYLLHRDICYHVHLFGRTAKTKKNKRTRKADGGMVIEDMTKSVIV